MNYIIILLQGLLLSWLSASLGTLVTSLLYMAPSAVPALLLPGLREGGRPACVGKESELAKWRGSVTVLRPQLSNTSPAAESM